MKKFFSFFGVVAVVFSLFVITQLPQSAEASSIYQNRAHAMVVDYPNNQTKIFLLNTTTGELTLKKTINNFIGDAMRNDSKEYATEGGHYSLAVLGRDQTDKKLYLKSLDADLYYAENNSVKLPEEFQNLSIKGNTGSYSFLAENPAESNQQYSLNVSVFLNNQGQPTASTYKTKLVGQKVPSGLSEANQYVYDNNGKRMKFLKFDYGNYTDNQEVSVSLENSSIVTGLENKSCVAQFSNQGPTFCSVWSSGWFDSSFGSDLYNLNSQGDMNSSTASRVRSYSNSSWAGTKYIAGFASESSTSMDAIVKDSNAQKHGLFSPEVGHAISTSQTYPSSVSQNGYGYMPYSPNLQNDAFLGVAQYKYVEELQAFGGQVFVAKDKASGQHYLYPSKHVGPAYRYNLQAPFTTLDDIAYSKQQEALIFAGRFWGSDKTYISKINLNHENKTATYTSLGEVNANINAGLAQRANGDIEVYKDGKIYRLDLPKNGSPSLVKLHDVPTIASDGKQVKSCSTFTAYNNWYYCSVNSNRTYGNAATDDYYRMSPLNNYQPDYLGTDKSLYDVY
jgi:hypothetical protein